MHNLVLRLSLVLAIVITLAGALGGSPASAAGWANQLPLSIDHTRISASLANFPVLLHLSGTSGINKTNLTGIFSSLANDNNRKKIKVTTDSAGNSQCYVEISKWDTAGQQAFLWVRVPSLSASTDTPLYFWYDTAQAENTAYVGDTGSSPAQQVWAATPYDAVWHLVEQGKGTSGEYKDSTSHGYHGTAMKAPSLVFADGQYWQRFVESQKNWISFGNQKAFSLDAANAANGNGTNILTVSVMYRITTNNPQGTNSYAHYICKGTGSGGYEWALRAYDNPGESNRDQNLSVYLYNPDGGQGSGASNWAKYRDTGGYMPVPSVQHIVGIYDYAGTGEARLLRNGVYDDDGVHENLVRYPIRPRHGTGVLEMGQHFDWGRFFTGDLAEFRIAHSRLSDSWLQADNYCQRDNLIKYGTVSTSLPPASPTSPAVATGTVSGVSTTTATLNGNLTSLGSSSSVSVSFDYGTTTAYGSSSIAQTRTAAGTFGIGINGCSPNTTYHYRAKATGATTAYGSDMTFTTTSNSTSTPAAETFGLNSGNASYSQHSNAIQAMRFQNIAAAGILNKLEVNFADSTPSGKVRLGVYADSNGRPGALLLDAGEATVANGWVSISNLNLSVALNSYYWLSYTLQSTNGVSYQSRQPSNSHYWADNVSYGPLPASYPSGSGVGSNNNQFIMRAAVQ